MMKISLLFTLFILLVTNSFCQSNATKQEVDFVNPLIGTAATGFAKGLDGGGTMPSVGPPFAMTNFVAQTGESKMSRMNYFYEDSSIIGFLASHQPTVWMGDYGYVSVMPRIGALKVLPGERALTFSHQNEVSTPFYYSVLLNAANNQHINAEMASTSRCGILQFTFPASQEAHIIIQGINLNPEIKDWANDFEERIKTLSATHTKIWYMADGVYSMYGDFPPMKELVQLMDRYEQFYLYMDDSHGMSWAGPNGTGYVMSQLKEYPKKLFLTASTNKSFVFGW